MTRELVHRVQFECNGAAKCRGQRGLRVSVGCPVHYSRFIHDFAGRSAAPRLALRGCQASSKPKTIVGARALSAREPDVAGIERRRRRLVCLLRIKASRSSKREPIPRPNSALASRGATAPGTDCGASMPCCWMTSLIQSHFTKRFCRHTGSARSTK